VVGNDTAFARVVRQRPRKYPSLNPSHLIQFLHVLGAARCGNGMGYEDGIAPSRPRHSTSLKLVEVTKIHKQRAHPSSRAHIYSRTRAQGGRWTCHSPRNRSPAHPPPARRRLALSVIGNTGRDGAGGTHGIHDGTHGIHGLDGTHGIIK
jgi:hypothetical protein